MEKQEKDVLKDFMETIKKSWTWDRLKENERLTFTNCLNWNRFKVKGTYKQKWNLLANYYDMFIFGIESVDENRFKDLPLELYYAY